jgi:hypothetical protein
VLLINLPDADAPYAAAAAAAFCSCPATNHVLLPALPPIMSCCLPCHQSCPAACPATNHVLLPGLPPIMSCLLLLQPDGEISIMAEATDAELMAPNSAAERRLQQQLRVRLTDGVQRSTTTSDQIHTQ